MFQERRSTVVSVILAGAWLAAAPLAFSQILPTARGTVWNPGVPGGVPSRTTVCANVNAPSGDATSAIQSAINACPAGQVVQLAAGTFNINGVVNINKGITLRGMGPTRTLLKKPSGTGEAAVVIGRQFVNTGSSTNLTSTAVKGTSSVMVASTSGFAVGQLVLVDRTPVTGQSFWSSDCDSSCQGWFGRTGRPVGQTMQIAAISGAIVTFTTPFHIDFDTAHAAQMTAFGQAVVSGAGLEDLKVYGGEGYDGGGNIYFELAVNSWAARVEGHWSLGASVRFVHTLRCTVRDSYFHETPDPNPGGGGYGISVDTASADNLIENNISWAFNKVILFRASGGGNVVGYNYFEDGYGSGYKSIPEVGLNASHMTTPHYELFEGNEAFNLGSDARWGNSIYITFFRNHATGLRRSLKGLGLSDGDGRKFVEIKARHYWYNFIGNVIGNPGMSPNPGGTSFTYEDSSAPYNDNPIPMYFLGSPDSAGTPGISGGDPQVVGTILREGNFDYASNSVRWDTAAQTIPNSLYLTSKPAFFGSYPWPWVDPVGTTKIYTLPARARFDNGSSKPAVKANFYTVTPCRVADTRNAQTASGSGGPGLATGQTRDFQVTGLCGIPTDALAVAANVTAVIPSAVGNVTVFPPGGSATTSTLNFIPGRTRANSAIVGLGTTGTVSVFCNTGASGGTHFIIDVVGYYK